MGKWVKMINGDIGSAWRCQCDGHEAYLYGAGIHAIHLITDGDNLAPLMK